MLQAGERMPEFTLRNAQREEVTRETFAGAPAILAFFPMAFTGG